MTIGDMNVLTVTWFTNQTVTGIVVAKNAMDETHVYIGTVAGIDEKSDIQHILDYGTKVKPYKFVEPLLPYLK